MEWMHLRDDPLLVILPPSFDLGGASSFPVQRFEGLDFLMPSPGFHQDITRALNAGGVSPNIRTTQVSDSVIISMVEHGLGVSILSELVLKAGPASGPGTGHRGAVEKGAAAHGETIYNGGPGDRGQYVKG